MGESQTQIPSHFIKDLKPDMKQVNLCFIVLEVGIHPPTNFFTTFSFGFNLFLLEFDSYNSQLASNLAVQAFY